MPGKWKWEGLDRNGKPQAGEIEVKDERELKKTLRNQGIRVRKVVPPSMLDLDLGELLTNAGLTRAFGQADLLSFTKQLSTMISAGIPILQALEIFYKSEKVPSLKKAVHAIATDVGEGKTISEAMAKQKGFDALYCNLVKAGEAGGILDAILKKLAEHMEKQQKIRQQIKSAMIYPVIVVVIGVLVIWVMMRFVVPKITEMIKETGQALPYVTQLVIDVSNFFQAYTFHMIGAIIVAGIGFRFFVRTKEGKEVFDNVMMKMPLFGQVIIKGNLTSFTRTLSTMLSAGISLVDSLTICIDTVDNVVISRDLINLKKAVVEGKTLTDGLLKINYFPTMVAQMVRVGEQTGNLDSMLIKIAEVFEEQVNQLVGNMTKMIEPIIIVVLGGCVATIMIAMYLPVFMSAGGADGNQ